MFPNETGFSVTNLKYMKRWYSFYAEEFIIRHQVGDELQMPDYFLSDIADVDERSRVETEEGWTMIILRVPYMNPTKEPSRSPYTTVPLGIILKKDICITVCYHITFHCREFFKYYVVEW